MKNMMNRILILSSHCAKKIVISSIIFISIGLIGCQTPQNIETSKINQSNSANEISAIDRIGNLPSAFKPNYKIAETRNSNYANVERLVVSIILPSGLKKEDVENNFRHVIVSTYQEKKPHAITVWGYKTGDDLSGNFTVGESLFAKNGQWSDDSAADALLKGFTITNKIKESYLNPAKSMSVGETVILTSDLPSGVRISNDPAKWEDSNILGKIANGTKAKILEVKIFPGAGSFADTVMYKIKPESGKLEGWVFDSNVKSNV